MKVPLTKGYEALIDDEDAELVLAHKWHAIVSRSSSHGIVYAQANTRTEYGRGHVSLHRLLMSAPAGMAVDHINHDGLDNRRSNLRVVTHQENLVNQRPRKNQHGFRGVVKVRDTFYGYLTVNKRNIYTASCETPEAAALAYDALAREMRGAFAYQNFPIADHVTSFLLPRS